MTFEDYWKKNWENSLMSQGQAPVFEMAIKEIARRTWDAATEQVEERQAEIDAGENW